MEELLKFKLKLEFVEESAEGGGLYKFVLFYFSCVKFYLCEFVHRVLYFKS